MPPRPPGANSSNHPPVPVPSLLDTTTTTTTSAAANVSSTTPGRHHQRQRQQPPQSISTTTTTAPAPAAAAAAAAPSSSTSSTPVNSSHSSPLLPSSLPSSTSFQRPGSSSTTTNTITTAAASAADRPSFRSSSSAVPSADADAAPPTSPFTTRSFTHDGEDIEMEPLAGHRRRRSSLMNPAGPAIAGAPGATGPGGVGAGGIGAPGVQGQRTVGGLQIQTTNLLADEPKIVEEGANEDETGRLLPGSSRHGSRADDGSESWSSDNDVRDDEETGLTSSERKKRRMRRKKNTRLDQRIVRDGITAEEKKEADQNVARRLAINGLFIGLWYFFSLMISIYNKWMFGKGKLNFAFPLFTTSLHMLVQFTLASVILYLFPSLRPKRGRQSPSDRGRSRHSSELDKQPLMTKMFYLTRIGPCGAATGLDIGLGNMSLKFITLTFYTMCKSSTLAFVLTFAFIFGLEKPTWRLIGIIGTMTIGVVMMVTGEVSFHLGGFALIISAAFFSGFRWGLTQMLLLRNPATSNPFSSIFFLAPVMFLTLICIAIPAEGPIALYHGFGQLIADRGPVLAPLILIFPGCIAFAMTVSEFALLQRTSVVTLSIAGICKEVVTIIAAALVFGDTLTPINFVGLITTIGAISAYNWIKITKMRSEAQTDVHRAHMPPPSASISASAGASPIISDDEPVSAVSFRRSGDYDEPLVTASGDIVPNLSPPARHEDDTRRPAAA